MEQVCETCARWVPRDFREDWGDEGGWWCPAARCRVDYSSYPPCGKAKWELRETGKAEIDKIMSEVKFTDLFGVLGKEGEGNER